MAIDAANVEDSVKVKNRRGKANKPNQSDMTTATSIGRSYVQESYQDAYTQVMNVRLNAAKQEMLRVVALIEAWDADVDGTEGLLEYCARIRRGEE